MKQVTLLKTLLDADSNAGYAIAAKVGVSSATLSRLASGLHKSKDVLDRLASYFAPSVGKLVDGSMLQVGLTGPALIACAEYLRKGGKV
jgi:hypothetical protein